MEEKKITILLVEDHPLFRIGLKQILSSRFPESEIQEAESVSSAKTLLSKTVFDVIFLDLNIGEESGLDFLKEIKTNINTLKNYIFEKSP